jgi:hypothetical protein
VFDGVSPVSKGISGNKRLNEGNDLKCQMIPSIPRDKTCTIFEWFPWVQEENFLKIPPLHADSYHFSEAS